MTIPYAMSWEEPARARAEGYDHDHEILVALPPSYHVSPERSYPVLWSMDGAMAFAVTSGIVNLYTVGKRIPEIIVVGVGHGSETGVLGSPTAPSTCSRRAASGRIRAWRAIT